MNTENQLNGSSRPHGEQPHGLSRRNLLKIGLGLALGAAVGETLTGCSIEGANWEQVPFAELSPQEDSEKKMYETLKVFNDLKDKTGTSVLGAAYLTQAVTSAANADSVAAMFKRFTGEGASADDAPLLVTSSTIDSSSADMVSSLFRDAKGKVRQSEDAPNVVSISAFTGADLQKVVDDYNTTRSNQPLSYVSTLVMADVSSGKANDARASLEEIKGLGVTDENDVAAMLFARTFSDATLNDILAIQKELAGMEEINPIARGNLIAATLYNDLDLESTLEAYNFAGSLEGMTTEAASMLAISLFANNIPKTEEAKGVHTPSTSGHVYILPHYGGYYGTRAYPMSRTSTSKFTLPSKTSSFSKPGVAPARSGGIGKGSTSTKSGGTSARGGSVAGRGGVAGGKAGGGS